ncbi:pleckstrin homology domain-containing family A member 5 isoform X4 [Oryzias melastigma]|uniref:pleckstrin homology domain-containing family A member 5 isoform X4 n=1 Tax=Oryzias melastigma TaxID=30732 RepID=UPI000CF7C212|nr:pleckstrin homology domain-containing family A member 5 isoform X4 [Oryzias melastigma]
MAADPQPDWLSCLPSCWTFGVTRDGRIFFINEDAKSTSWLHPVTGEAVVTGHRSTPDLPTGWEEGYTFEGARCFINHNERKVTCKHPVSGCPSQDNCIFVVSEHVNCGKFVRAEKALLARPALKASDDSSSEKKERPMSTMSEASNYTGGSDYSTFPGSPATASTTTTTTTSASSARLSRSSKKIHNFGKRSNSIKRNINIPAVKSGWLYKQDSSGMKLWKKRWFVLSDMCLFYYRDEKEDNILGSILLPSFHISMLSVDDHVSKKYAFKATHPNMRTYYFCTETAKEMEVWMKVMTDAALVQSDPVRRLDKLKVDPQTPLELNNMLNHKVLTLPEIQNNERNREPMRQHSLSQLDYKRLKEEKQNSKREYYTLQRDGERYAVKKDGVSYMLQKDGDRYLLHKDGEKFLLRKDGEKYSVPKDGEMCPNHRDLKKCGVQKVDNKYTVIPSEEKYAPEQHLLTKDGGMYDLQKARDQPPLHQDGQKLRKDVKRQLSLREGERCTMRETNKYGTIHVVNRYGSMKEVRKYCTLRDGDRYAPLTDSEKCATLCHADKYVLQRDLRKDRTLSHSSSMKLQTAPDVPATPAQSQAKKPPQTDSLGCWPEEPNENVDGRLAKPTEKSPAPVQELENGLSRTSSVQRLENFSSTLRTKGGDNDARSMMSYQTLPRNMPSHGAQPRFSEGYCTLPRNSMMRPDSICSVAGSAYDQALRPAFTGSATSAEKRRSMRDDTMWQLYEWQQRQARQSLAAPTGAGHYATLPNKKTMDISHYAAAPSIPTSPSHSTVGLYSTFSPPRQSLTHNPANSHSEVTSPAVRGDGTLERRPRSLPPKYGYSLERRSVAACTSTQPITAQTLQGKTPEELTLLLIKLRRQQAELNSLREHTVAQLVALGMEGPNAKTDVLTHHLQRNLTYLDSQINPDNLQGGSFNQHTKEIDIDTKLSRLCEQDKLVRTQTEKVQQLHREQHTLETALLLASQELGEQSSSSSPFRQSLVQQRDELQSGLLSTCRELSRVNTELEQSWREYDQLEADVILAKSNLLEQLKALGSPQTEPPSQQHIHIQKELWRIQDVMEALQKNKPQRSTDSSSPASRPLSSLHKNEAITLLPLCPPAEVSSVPLRPHLPQNPYSAECPPHTTPCHSQPSSRPAHTCRPEARKTSSRNGAHSQSTDYRLYKSEPELTTVKEELDEANNEEKDKTETSTESKEAPASKGHPYPVGIVSPRTKSPMSPLESSSIASYVTLRKARRPEARSQDRPRSAVEQAGFGEREVGRPKMSVEEQLERIRRNQEALSLRERRRETPSRSPSFSKDNLLLQKQTQTHMETACPDHLELEAAVQRLKNLQDAGRTEGEEEQQREDRLPIQNNNAEDELCESQRVVILDNTSQPQRVEIVNFQPFEDDGDHEESLSSSPTKTTTESRFQTSSPEIMEDTSLQTISEKSLDSFRNLTADDKNHNTKTLAAHMLDLVSSDT